jgi:hypothetical protein
LIHLFPACYLRRTRTAGGNAGDEGSDTEDDDDDDDAGVGTDDDPDDDDNDDDIDDVGTDAPNVYHAKVQGLRKDFLSEFPNEEVAEMWQINNFMVFVSSCTRNALPNPSAPDRVSLHFIHFITCTYLIFTS